MPDRSLLDMAALRALMDTVDKMPFPNTAVLLSHWIEGRLGIPASLNNFFCAELAALSSESLGLIETDRKNPANKYAPARFPRGLMNCGSGSGPRSPSNKSLWWTIVPTCGLVWTAKATPTALA